VTDSRFARFMVDNVRLFRLATKVNAYGETVPDWTVPPIDIYNERGWFTRTGSDEMTQGREAITDNYELSLPAESMLSSEMYVQHDGATYEVRGSVQRAKTPTGVHHVVAQLRKVEG
jgi:hypothetical protein